MPGRDKEARRIARYADRLMAAGSAAQDAVSDALTDPASRAAARRLRADLVRVHPSFRFEEDLAAKLLAAAARMRDGEAPEAPAIDSDATIIRIPIAPPDGVVTEPDGLVAESGVLVAESPAWRRFHAARPYIVRGVAASAAALSIGALVAWRVGVGRPGGSAIAAAAGSASVAAASAAASAAVASAAAASGKIAIAAQPPLHRGRGSAVTRGSAVIHGILGVVY